MKTVTLYTDGACSGNPGPGGWGAILEYNGVEKELSGGEENTTNNRMELTAVIKGLQALNQPCIVELYSDSKYVIDALEKGWAWGWRKKGWIKSDKKPALNPDLWEILLDLTMKHEVHYHWVKGHAENPKNNRCDEMAVAESKQFKTNTVMRSRGKIMPKPDLIISQVSAYYQISTQDLLGTVKKNSVVKARQIAMYLMRQMTDRSLPEIGEVFSRDHSTVLYAIRKIEEILESDDDLQTDIQTITDRITNWMM